MDDGHRRYHHGVEVEGPQGALTTSHAEDRHVLCAITAAI